MSEGSAASATPKEEKKNSLLIVKSHQNALMGAETFLKNRQWEVYSCIDLKQALTILIQKQPSYVMISVDHPHKKVKMLPKILSQAFPVAIIVFSEVQSANSLKALTEIGSPYTLVSPVSGPAVERMVLRIQKDQQAKAEEKNRERNGGASATGDNKDEVISIKGSSQAQAQEALRALMSGDAAAGNEAGNPSMAANNNDLGTVTQMGLASSKKESNGYWAPVEPENKNIDPGVMIQKGAGSLAHNMHNQGEGGNSTGGPFVGTMGPGMSGPGASSGTDGSTNGGFGGQGPGGSGNNFNGSQSGAGMGSSMGGQFGGGMGGPTAGDIGSQSNNPGTPGYMPRHSNQDDPNNSGFYNPDGSPKGNGASQIGNARGVKVRTPASFNHEEKLKSPLHLDKNDRKPRKDIVTKREATNKLLGQEDSIIIKGTQRALDESVTLTNEENTEAIEKSTNVACILVESPKFSGYLVAALGKDKKIDKSFIDIVKKRLFNFLRDNGENIKDDDSMSIKIKEVEFEAWAVEYAEFLRKSVHEGQEIAMAFFPRDQVQTELKESANKNMLSISMDDLHENAVVEFDLYVYMPTNKKYILYTPKGNVFYGNQKDRLKAKGIKEMHVKKDSVHDIKRYSAQNYLNSKIEEYQRKRQEELNKTTGQNSSTIKTNAR